MTGDEYYQLTNRVKVTAALHLLRDCITGENRGITETERAFFIERLGRIERDLSRKLQVIDDD